MNWRAAPNGQARVGVVTSRRVGSAVVRSRARRLLREAYRLNQHRVVPGLTLVLVARPSLAGKPLSTVVRDLERCLREADLLADRERPPALCAPSL
jgi:ribonuclease P protein component